MTVNPDTVKAQMEGGIIFGITPPHSAITIKDGRVEQNISTTIAYCASTRHRWWTSTW